MSENKKEYEYLNARGDKSSWIAFGTVGLIGAAAILFLNNSKNVTIPEINHGNNSQRQYTNSGVMQNLMKRKNVIEPAQ